MESHPAQMALANEVLSPPEAKVIRAQKIIEDRRWAEALGKRAAAPDGRMTDAASEPMAQKLLVPTDAIAAKEPVGWAILPTLPEASDHLVRHRNPAREILARFGVPVPRGGLACRPDERDSVAASLFARRWSPNRRQPISRQDLSRGFVLDRRSEPIMIAGSAPEKLAILAAAGIKLAPNPTSIAATVAMVLARRQAAQSRMALG